MNESTIRSADLSAFPRMAHPRLPQAFREAAGIALMTILFLSAAIWNGFPLMFYDTGAYLVEGLQGAFLVERSPVYSLFLAGAGSAISLWPVAILQAAMTAYMISETARAEVPHLSLPGLVGVGAGLAALTGIAWYAGQIEPDCMTPLLVLGCYLLLFHTQVLGKVRTRWVAGITGLAVACHPSHLGLIGGLLIAAAALGAARFAFLHLPKIRLLPGISALAIALALILVSNYALARDLFISRSGSVFVFARLMQDGIVKKLLDETCTGPATPYKLCAQKHRLARTANEWLWGRGSSFQAKGGFKGVHAEEQRIILDSLRRYPLLQLRMAVYDSVLQFFMFKTGDGIESQIWILKPDLEKMMPGQLPAYLDARQQHNRIRFQELNMIHVTVGMLSLLGLALLLHHAALRRRWDEATLPGVILLALIGNAIICGTFSNPHDRYQSRVIWLPALVLLLARARDPRALQPVEPAG